MQIIDFNSTNDIRVKFLDDFGYEIKTFYGNFKIGQVKNPYNKQVFGVGYLGDGRYMAKKDNVITDTYNAWKNLLARCYSEKYRYLHPAYEGCSVCDEWLNYQNFCKWYYENYYIIEGERVHIDKDILVKGNKIYSPETCIFVPQRINMIFMSKSKSRDEDLPNSIYRCKTGFSSSYNGKSLGVYKTLSEAIEVHDLRMREHIENVAREYANKIPEKVYNAILNY